MHVITYAILMLAAVILTTCGVLADDLQDAATIANTNRELVTRDGVVDCDDAALKAFMHLAVTGHRPDLMYCKIDGVGHAWVRVDGMAIDWRFDEPVPVWALGCTDVRVMF